MAKSSEHPSATERAYASVRDDIIEGRFAPGTMLGEGSLAEQLDMSRTPVRVALARLQNEGWIVVYPKRGALVQGLNERAIAELADARFALESMAVSKASTGLRAQLANLLAESIEQQRQAFANDDVRRFIDLTVRFHRGFVEAGGNSVLLELYDRLSDRQRFILFASGERLLARCTEIITEHERLVAHLRAGDTVRFAETLHAHISETGAMPVAAFAIEGVSSVPSFEH